MTDSPLRSGLDTSKSSDLDNVSLRAFELLCTRRAQARSFDPDRRINDDVLARVLRATQRAPTAFNLQPWNAIIVQDPRRRASLCEAALGQRVVSEAPVTIVFAGDTQPCRNASKARALGARTGYYPAHYEPLYMRYVLYMLHGGPCGVMQPVKAMTSWVYASLTGTPMLTVPPSLRAYAWKQTMLPVGYLLLAATAAGLGTAVLEGIDEERVKAVVELPASYTVPCLVALGYEKLLSPDAPVPSPRFDPKEVFSRDVFGTPINIFDFDGKHDK